MAAAARVRRTAGVAETSGVRVTAVHEAAAGREAAREAPVAPIPWVPSVAPVVVEPMIGPAPTVPLSICGVSIRVAVSGSVAIRFKASLQRQGADYKDHYCQGRDHSFHIH
jgi:hypothetical protein